MKIQRSNTMKKCGYCYKLINATDLRYRDSKSDKHFHLECVRERRERDGSIIDKVKRFFSGKM